MNGALEVRVEGTSVERLVTTPPIAAKVLPGPVLVLVGSAAGLLTGDRLRLRVDLARGARLEVRTTAATIAHPCLDGGSTGMDIECHVAAGAHLAWLPEPVVACGGCHHRSHARLTLEAGGSVVWLDALTLGRTGETAGRFEQRLDVELDGRPLLREGLRLGVALGDIGPGGGGSAGTGGGIGGIGRVAGVGPAGTSDVPGWDGPAVVGPYRHVAALHLLGRRLRADVPGTMQLAGPGTTARFLAHRGDELARKVDAVLPLFLAVS